MKPLLSLLLAAAALLPARAENLLRNPGFEEPQRTPWQSWPGPSSLSRENPASGGQCIAVPALPDKSEYLLQKNIPVEPGCAYICSLKSRSDDCARPAEVTLVFHDASGAVSNSIKVITCSATTEWVKSRGAGIASETAATVDVSIVVAPGAGTFYFDDVSLEKGDRILGGHGTFRIERTKDGLQIVSPHCTLDFIEKRNFGLASASFGEKNRIRNFFFNVPLPDEGKIQSSFYIVNRNIVTDLKLTERSGSFLFTVEETFPHAKVKRSVECWDNEPYIRFSCELKALTDFTCTRCSMDFGFTGGVIAQGRAPHVKYTKWLKPNYWFNLDRPDDPRVISYLDKDGKDGLALIGLDKYSWEELPGRLLSNTSGKDGDGFGIGLIKWGKRDVRKGDKVLYDVLVSPVESHEKAIELAERLSPAD